MRSSKKFVWNGSSSSDPYIRSPLLSASESIRISPFLKPALIRKSSLAYLIFLVKLAHPASRMVIGERAVGRCRKIPRLESSRILYGNKPGYPLISHRIADSLGTAAYHCRFFLPGLGEITRTYDFFPCSILTSLLPSMKLVYKIRETRK